MSDSEEPSADTQPIEQWEAQLLAPISADAQAADMPVLPPVRSRWNDIPKQTAKLAEVLLGAELTIAVAESLTGGELAAEIVRVPGISRSFMGGIVAYQHAAKRELLGVERSLLVASGAVHPEVAQQMAAGVRRRFSFADERSVDIGISTTGVAGPDASDGHEPGQVFVGIDSIFGDRVVKLQFANLVRVDDPVGTRNRIRLATVEAAIFNLLEHLAAHADN